MISLKDPMKKTLLLLIACSSISFGMTMDQAEKDQVIIPNFNDTESLTHETFENLLVTYHKDNKPFMIARVKSEGNAQPWFYDAQELHKSFTQNKNGIFKSSNTYRNPLDNLPITKIDYYKITIDEAKKDLSSSSENPALVTAYAGSYDDFSQPVQRWNALFPANAMTITDATTIAHEALALNQAILRSIRHRTQRSRLINGAPQNGPVPCCQTDYDAERDNCCLQCAQTIFLGPVMCALGLVCDIAHAPCVWQNRKDNPEGMQGRHHYCFFMRRICKLLCGISSIEIHGNQDETSPFQSSCKADCNLPSWDYENPND